MSKGNDYKQYSSSVNNSKTSAPVSYKSDVVTNSNVSSSSMRVRSKRSSFIRDVGTDSDNNGLIVSSSIGVVKVLLLILLMVNFFRALKGDTDYFSFERFFDVLLKSPSIPIDWISVFSWHVDIGDWGVMDWLADAIEWVINTFGSLLSTGMYLSVGIGNLVVFVGYFVGALFF